jgi:hypothetical protein
MVKIYHNDAIKFTLDVVISVFSSYSSDFVSTTDRLDALVVPVGADFLLEGDLLVRN